MRLLRPYIPLSVRVQVAERQLRKKFTAGVADSYIYGMLILRLSLAGRLQRLLRFLGFEKPQLDHNPALALRVFHPRIKKYTPAANDPNYLIYREAEAHRIKTHVRGDGAQYSDTTLMKRERRRKNKAKGKIKWKRKWPKGRKIAARVNPWRAP